MRSSFARFAPVGVLVASFVGACSSNSSDDDTSSAGTGNHGAGTAGISAHAGNSAAAGKSSGGNTGSSAGYANQAGEGGSAEGGMAGEGGSPGDGGMPGQGGTAGGGGSPPITLLDCKARDVTGATVVSGAINADQNWTGLVYVKDPVVVGNGATVTIAAGTDIVMAADSGLELGTTTAATLLARGTIAQPIRICGQQSKAGFWGGLVVGSKATKDVELKHLLVSDAGGKGDAVVLDAAVSAENLQVRSSGGNAVRASDFDPNSSAIWVDGATGAAVVLTSPSAATHFPPASKFTANTDNTAHLRFTTVSTDSTFADLGIPYVQESPVAVRDGAVLTIGPGVEYRMAADAVLDIGGNVGGLSVNGTTASPVTFRGVNQTPGFWNGIIFRSAAKTNSVISHARIRDGGHNGVNPLAVLAPIRLDNVQLDHNLIGAYIDEQGLAPSSTNLSITTTSGSPLTVFPNALVTLPRGGTFTGNGVDQILIEAGRFSKTGTVPNLGIPYYVHGDLITQDGAAMTLEPGTSFVMAQNVHLDLCKDDSPSVITALGTATAPIRFSGANANAGYWPGLTVGAKCTDSSFDYVEVGGGATACLTLKSSISVTHSKFFDCQGYGILKLASDSRDYVTGNTFTNVVSGSVGTLP